MSRWRKPGQPYSIEIDGIVLKCKPLKRGDAANLALISTEVKEKDNLEEFYKLLAEQIIEIEGFEESPAEVLDYQSHEIMLSILKAILGTSVLSEDESKNSLSSSVGQEAKPGEAVTIVEKDTVGTK